MAAAAAVAVEALEAVTVPEAVEVPEVIEVPDVVEVSAPSRPAVLVGATVVPLPAEEEEMDMKEDAETMRDLQEALDEAYEAHK